MSASSNSSKPEVSCLTLMGTGTIGGCVIQMIPDFMTLRELHIIDRRPDVEERVKELCETSVFAEDIKKIQIHCHQWTLSEENYEELLGPLFAKSDAVMDLTTVLSTVAMATLSDKHGCVYMNACIELFTKCFMSIQERHQIARDLKLKKTCVFEHGMNPGVVSHILRVAMKDAGLSAEDIDVVHITEYDDHILKPETRDPDAFYNTWSPFGLYEEAIERAELAWPEKQPFPLSENATQTEQMVVFDELSGYDVYMDSVTPLVLDDGTFKGFKKYQGFVVTHGETETIARELGNNVVCAFVFRTAPVATECLAKWQKEEAPKYTMMEGKNIETGGDTIGLLLRSSTKKKAWWMGSACTAEIARNQVSPIQNGATITVAAGCLVGIVWALANPDRGVVFPEEIDSFKAWDDCKKYMGHVNSMEVPYELVADMNVNPVIGKPQADRWTIA